MPWDFSGGLVVKTSLPMHGVWIRSLVRELRSHIPQWQKSKTENRSTILVNSIKTLKMVHIRKKNLKNIMPLR